MKVAILCDSHFGCRSDSKIFLEHQKIFFEEIFFPCLKKNSIDTVLHLGDIFDRRKHINFNTLYQSKSFFFDLLEKYNITMHAILGNHDTYFTTTNDINSPFLLLREYKNIHLYENDPIELEFTNSKIIMCPWLTRENQETSLEKISKSNAHILMGHFDIKGFEMMRGVVSSHGLDHRTFSQFESVFSGHYHHPSHHGNIRYLGTQYEMNWSDYDSVKGFYVLDTDTREIEFNRNPNRIFHKIDYDDNDLAIDEIVSLDTSSMKNCFVKVIVKNRTNPQLFDMFLDKLNETGAADVKTVEDRLDLSSVGIDDTVDDVKNTRDIMNTYVESIETNIQKEQIKTYVNSLYQKAMNI